MLHWKGDRVDVEALRDRISLRQSTGKGLHMGCHIIRDHRRQKSFLVDASGRLGMFLNLQAKD